MRMIRCALCPFSVPFVRSLKSGKVRMGRDTLTWHVQEKHPREYWKIRNFARNESSVPPASCTDADGEMFPEPDDLHWSGMENLGNQ